MNFLLDYLFPRRAETRGLYALSSAELLHRLPASVHDVRVVTLFEYAHPLVKELVWEIKYKGSRELARKVGVILHDALVQEFGEENFNEEEAILLVPMPTSDKRRLERGWNQSELLAKAVIACDQAQRFEYRSDILTKTRHTESQTRTESKSERLENLKGSMAAKGSIAGSLCVVIDDVFTTGATFAEAKRALAEAKARKVICLAIAH